MKRPGKLAVSRRAATAGLVGALVPKRAIAEAAGAVAKAARRPRFFTPAELALVDELGELIIPTDEHSPGARAAEVAWDLDRRFAELVPRIPAHAARRARFRAGLKLVDRLARNDHGVAFLAATPEQRVAVLTTMAAGEAAPKTPEERFFVELKGLVSASYYTSEIGIKRDIGYLGNAYWEEFVGQAVKPAAKVVPASSVKRR